jgi:hypothetical protein
MRWNYIRYENGMSHMVSDDLLTVIRDVMEHESPPGLLRDVESACEICLELGGMCSMVRPLEEFAFCGLTIWVPSEDLSALVTRWQVSPAVTALDREFHRFTSWPWKCLVVDPRQRSELLEVFISRADVAEHRAAQFWANSESPQETLRKYNESKDAFIPYGPDKIDRFRS